MDDFMERIIQLIPPAARRAHEQAMESMRTFFHEVVANTKDKHNEIMREFRKL